MHPCDWCVQAYCATRWDTLQARYEQKLYSSHADRHRLKWVNSSFALQSYIPKRGKTFIHIGVCQRPGENIGVCHNVQMQMMYPMDPVYQLLFVHCVLFSDISVLSLRGYTTSCMKASHSQTTTQACTLLSWCTTVKYNGLWVPSSTALASCLCGKENC